MRIDMNSGPIVAMIWEGRDAVKTGRGKQSLPSEALMCVVAWLGKTRRADMANSSTL